MPLVRSSSSRAVGDNISELRRSGYPQRQSIAIALSNQRRWAHKDDGGSVDNNQSMSDLGNPPSDNDRRDLRHDIGTPMARGGSLPTKLPSTPTPWTAAYARHMASGGPVVGLIKSPVPGRTDRLPMRVLQDSYVIPADVVSGTGQGNTDGGGRLFDKMFDDHHQRGTTLAPEVGRRGTVPIVAAGGEYVVPPQVVVSLGGGDMKRGHAVLDKMVKDRRKAIAKTMMQLPGPAAD